MRAVKHSLANFSFYDQKAIEKKLEQMAAQGWMICKLGNFFWTYARIQPQKLRFSVTYFPGASNFDPHPSEKQLTKEDFCAQDGWRLVLRWGPMQVFCTSRPDPVPIETDPVPQVENIHRTMKKMLLGQVAILAVILWSLALQIWQLRRDPADYLSSPLHLFSILLWLLLTLSAVLEIWSYFHWWSRAKKAAEDGLFLSVRPNKWLHWGLVVLAILFLLLALFGTEANMLFMFCWIAAIGLVSFLANRLMERMKKKGVSRRVNLVVSSACVMLLTLAALAGIVTAAIGGWIPLQEARQPVGSYEWKGHTFAIYDDPIPLQVEDLVDVDAQWSKEADRQESILLSYGTYRQDLLLTANTQGYELTYAIVDVKFPALYGFLKKSLFNARQDQVQDGFVFVDHFEPIDPSPWNAQEAYQLHWSDGLLDTYLVCWESRIVEIHFYWTPTQAQIQTAAKILHP